MMNVCLLNDSFPPVIDGVANVVMNYAKIMQEDKLANVLVGTPKYPGADYSEYPYRVIPYRSYDTTKIVKGYRVGDPLDIGEVADMAAFQPEIIHSHCPVSSTILGRLLRTKTDAPLIFTYHTKFDVDIEKAVKAKFIQRETIRALVNNISACDEVWVVSSGAGENLRSLGYEGEYRVVSNGVDFEKGRVNDSDVINATKNYDLPEGVPVFLFVGRIIRYKGIPLILDAMKKLDMAGQDFRMVFIGSGPDEEELKKKALELGLMGTQTGARKEKQTEIGTQSGTQSGKKAKCFFVGPVYDREILRAWNTRADLFLFPSTYDTNGIVVREAAACGLASVLIDGSCAAEGITHGKNGYLIDNNADAMYELLKQACKDMNHIHEIGQNAMDQIYISWKESVYIAKRRYEEILERKNKGELRVRHQKLTSQFLKFSMNLIEETDAIFRDVIGN